MTPPNQSKCECLEVEKYGHFPNCHTQHSQESESFAAKANYYYDKGLAAGRLAERAALLAHIEKAKYPSDYPDFANGYNTALVDLRSLISKTE